MSTTFNILRPEQVNRSRGFDDATQLGEELKKNIEGEVRFDDGSRALYATDGSNYRQVPIGVVIPRTIDDVLNTIATCRSFGAPLLSRGGGTSLAGQCCNVAVVMDFSKYLHHVIELNEGEKFAVVEPGTILDDLRKAANRHALTFGPDPSTHNHCTLGGMLGNNSCGVHAQMSGKTVDNTEEIDIVTYDGFRITAGWMNDFDLERGIREGGRKGEIYSGIKYIREHYSKLIDERYPHIPRRVSGYNLDQLLPGEDGRFNLARALVGSEGTLVTILKAKLRLVYWPPKQTLVVLGYPDIYEAADHVPDILPFKPMGLEAIDELLVKNMKTKHMYAEALHKLPKGNGWLLAQFGGETREESDAKAREMMDKLRKKPNPPDMKLYDDPAEEAMVWKTREAGLGATAFVPGEPVTWEGWEDSAVAPEKMGGYLRDLCKLYEKHGYIGAMYGHFGMGCLHTRISFDLQSDAGIRNFRSFLDDATSLVVRYVGSFSGEHGDGQSKAEFLEKMFGPELMKAFREFKSLWDPEWKMNPGKLVEPYRVDENLRLGAHYDPWKPKTHFQFPDDDGEFSHATLRCVGVGECRRMSVEAKQTMCPSFQVLREEKHSTRGRAHLLFEMLQGNPIKDRWRDEAVKESLDLCLSCKGCKGDCPVNVDIATYKAEFLSHYWEGRIRPLHTYAFGFIDQWARLASLWPGMVNLINGAPIVGAAIKGVIGIPQQRTIPEFATQTFKSWFKQRDTNGAHAKNGRVILWADTFNNNFFPETAQAAVDVLEDAGYQVNVPQGHLCCGRPLYDFGFLDAAKIYLQRILDSLRAEIEAGTRVVVLEPSCAAVFREELHQLFPHDKTAVMLRKQTMLLSELLAQTPDYEFPKLHARAVVHGHCHHKSIFKMDAEDEALKKMGVDHEMLASGCCGMAGSFGFERDKYDVSIAAGERVLLPAVRHAEDSTLVIANGFSCREQIQQTTNRRALHLAEVMQMAIHKNTGTSPRPEQAIYGEPERRLRRSKIKAAAALAAFAAAGVGIWLWNRNRQTS